MRVLCANHSSYPVPSGDPLTILRAVVGDQESAGLDLVTDGQIEWADPVTPVLAAFDGVRLGSPQPLPGGLGVAARPIVEGKVRRHRSFSAAAYERAAQCARRPVKAVLTGPYTLAHCATIATTAYRSPNELAAELGALLAHEVAALAAAGAAAVQIDEPLILQHPDDARVLRVLLEPLYDAAGGAAQVIVSTYGADATPLYAQLNSLPADVIAVDCATAPALFALIAESGAGKPLALGIADGRAELRLGSPAADLTGAVQGCLQRYVHDTIILQPARGLRGLPLATARATLALVAAVGAAIRT
jgi:5-methyltetrahydropteroyltriglutamate--homocysteine methyltransferase